MLTAPTRDGRSGDPPPASPRRRTNVTLLREIKIDSPVHRLWAGTKLVAVAALSVVLSYFPSWGTIGLVLLLLLGTARIARIPAGAWPRPPRWFWVAIVVSGAIASNAGGSPHLTVAGTVLGLGALDAYCRFVAVGIVLLLVAALVGWTTPLGEIAPAVARLLAPLRWLKVPVDEAAVAVALCVRSLPLLVGEMRTLAAARRLRPPPPRPARSTWRRWLDEPVDLIVAALVVSLRRAGDLAEAITARGGTGMIAARTGRPGWGDLAATAVVGAVCAGAVLIPS